MGISRIIMKRSVNLSKTYLIISAFVAVMAIGISSLSYILPDMPGEQIPIDLQALFSVLFVGLGSMTAILVATPVLLLFVYDKNNGVLEYLLSTGMNQSDLFRSYLEAALTLAGIALLAEALGYTVLALYFGGGTALLPIILALTAVMGLSTVAFTTVLMMAFSSLQKQRVGANQPLGIGLGVMLVFPSLLIPQIFSSIALNVVSINAAIDAALALMAFLLAGRLVKREKLLP
jgi:hypothetical protein